MTEQLDKSADISPCGKYRYSLHRTWDKNWSANILVWVMLNPSTADAEIDDPTIRKCIGFAKRLAFSGIAVVNLFAFRLTDPKRLRFELDPIGPDNDEMLKRIAGTSYGAVAAWGAEPSKWPGGIARVKQVLSIGDNWSCLGTTKDGYPRHPLYVPYEARLQDYRKATP